MLNGLYGKFGQKGSVTRAVPVHALHDLKHPPVEFTVWNGLALFVEERTPPPWGNNVWAAIVTARARVRLSIEMERLEKRGCRVLYCDTDSVAFQGKARGYSPKAKRPGQFELRGEYRQALIVGKKEYSLQEKDGSWKLYAKGVPFAAREEYLRNGSARFVRPVRFREAARRGLIANDWREHSKTRRTKLEERADPSGRIRPVEIHERGS